jgi:hypothetical protein
MFRSYKVNHFSKLAISAEMVFDIQWLP